ncbi:MAG: hypothetical protein AAGP08_17815, partial [Pseudomonadota bacterium]
MAVALSTSKRNQGDRSNKRAEVKDFFNRIDSEPPISALQNRVAALAQDLASIRNGPQCDPNVSTQAARNVAPSCGAGLGA